MRNTGILLFLAGIYIVINSGSFRDLVFGKAQIAFLNPKTSGANKGTTPEVNASTGFVTGQTPIDKGSPTVNDATGFVTYG